MSLSERIENAETKDELEKIGKDELGVDVDKRKGLETIRVDLQSLAEDQVSEGQGKTPAQNDAESPDKDAPESADTSQEGTPASKMADAEKTPDQGESAPAQEKPRLLRHRGNGRVFTYSAALAAKRDMEEV
ncbi:hypothetical protein [Halomonas elongata]|uniref:Uncharacterized protein n=1 Tax=Halomonas elongata (strain ATCC 33173 / DSM 2581 / NBRC 15536 / NCIMB 2198 / 1H9) TaxID=768066 RepID=E1V347_HALED|nr:hypothetical protein [Halomonas elongata]WBF19807.1 hypothetical protein LM502_09010 [Halomonas elongata]WPU48676.1 hypothetical protein SR933_07235 [Halomonas elongata DSM 2581]CBV42526.1 uncharacterized protein HELO_2642 [Halomonas elongata DSM 2581]